MPRVAKKKRPSPQASPQVLSTKRNVRVTRAASKKPSSISETPKRVTNNDSSGQKLIRRSKRTVLTKQAGSSSKADSSITQENKKRSMSTRAVPTENKTSVKSKRGVLSSSLNKSKNESNIKRRKITRAASKNVSTVRQMSLQESFTNQVTLKRLRSRKVQKADDGKLVEKHISPNRQTSSVFVKRLSGKQKAKVPVYKSVPLEDSANNESEVYDFKFDINDSKERVPRKKRKRTVKRNVVKKIQRIAYRKHVGKEKAISENVPPVVPPTKKAGKKSVRIMDVKPSEPRLMEEIQNQTVAENLAEQVEMPKENLESPWSLQESVVTDKVASTPVQKPTVVAQETLSNIKVTISKDTSVSNSGAFMPFRPTNIFNNKSLLHERSMTNNSIFEKSLSPIMKSSTNFDPSSPWRAPPLFTFSQVKTMFQSTPQNNKLGVSYGRFVRGAKSETKSILNVPKVLQKKSENIENILQKNNENVPVEKPLPAINTMKKNPTAHRRFGTEITNRDHSAPGNNPLGDVSERTVVEPESSPPTAPPIVASISAAANATTNTTANAATNVTVNTSSHDLPHFEEAEDKENVAVNFQTLKKSPRKGLKKSSHSPLKAVRNVENERPKEILEPVPGPSGLQNLKMSNEQRLLRQSNLNSFLNLVETPQSTTIKTRHGIFDDSNSSPISGKSLVKKQEDPKFEIKTAFGFNEDDTNETTSSGEDKSLTKDVDTEKQKKRVPLQTITQKGNIKPFVPARLSLGEIRNNLLLKNAKRRAKENVELEKEEKTKDENTETVKSPIKKKNTIPVDVRSFSDTFDVLSETGEIEESTTTVPLFADLEPSHFTKPARHSYKRKRAVRFSFSEESSGEDVDVHEPEVKRKRVGKLRKKDEKRLQDWINNVNQTFEEIDQHDLLVE